VATRKAVSATQPNVRLPGQNLAAGAGRLLREFLAGVFLRDADFLDFFVDFFLVTLVIDTAFIGLIVV
jgi:hypothetical protein